MWNCGLQMKVTEGSARGSIHPLDAQCITLGRAQPGAVRQVGWVHLRDETVSGVQAELLWREDLGKFLLINRSETNPTKVNEVEVSEIELNAGDQIRMGRCVVDLQETDRRFVTRRPVAAVLTPAVVWKRPPQNPRKLGLRASFWNFWRAPMQGSCCPWTRNGSRWEEPTTRPILPTKAGLIKGSPWGIPPFRPSVSRWCVAVSISPCWLRASQTPWPGWNARKTS